VNSQKNRIISTIENIYSLNKKMTSMSIDMSSVELVTQKFVGLSKLVYFSKDKIDKSLEKKLVEACESQGSNQ
jgi:hypothetical protein